MISDKLDNNELVCEGWLTKSPPTTRVLRARWRRRYFILRHSGQLPGQYFLYYFSDRNCRKVKGQIDLDQCDQVDAGLRIEKYQHLFTIRTPKRTFYLAAETAEEMNKWVDCVCHVCGLKPFTIDDVTKDGDNISQATTGIIEISPPVTPSAIITGPYIPISECITGKPIKTDSELKKFMLQHGSSPKKGVLAALQSIPSGGGGGGGGGDHRADSYDMPRLLHPPHEFVIDSSSTPPPSPSSESVFTDDESMLQTELLLSTKKPAVNWETFPRPSDSSVDESDCGVGVNALTLKAERKFAKALSSVPPRPPKPTHLMTSTTAISIPSTSATNVITTANDNIAATTIAVFTATPTCTTAASSNETWLEETNSKRVDNMYDIPRSYRTTGRQIYRNLSKHKKKQFHEIQYLDLDLEVNDKNSQGLVRSDSSVGVLVKKSSESTHMPSTATVYKTVDFLKTEAFNRTRIEIEEERNRLCLAAESTL